MTPVDDALHTPDDSPKPYDVLHDLLENGEAPDGVIRQVQVTPPYGPAELAELVGLAHDAYDAKWGESVVETVMRALASRLAPEYWPVTAGPDATPETVTDPTLDEDEMWVRRLTGLIEGSRDEARAQLVTARTGEGPEAGTRMRMALLLEAAIELEARILALVPGGRDRSMALTAVEDALIRANRAFFAPAAPARGRYPDAR